MYRPNKVFSTKFMILNPLSIEKVAGKNVYTYPEETDEYINASFATFGGTETQVNGVLVVIDTATIETWYRPDITSNTRFKRVEDGKVFKVEGDPEDIEFRHQFLKLKVESL